MKIFEFLCRCLAIARSNAYTRLMKARYYFAFTKRERLGFRVMLLILATSIFLRAWGLVKPVKEWDRIAEIIEKENGKPNIPRKGNSTDSISKTKVNGKSKGNYVPPEYMVKRKVIFDLNLADTFDLDELRGIGPTYARRIVEYRERLGGFTHVEQLREVWGIDSVLLEKIRPHVYIKERNLKKLNINTSTIRQMRNHPYLDYYQAKEIYLHREKYGTFSHIGQLKKVNLIDSGTYTRLQPYLSVDTVTITDRIEK